MDLDAEIDRLYAGAPDDFVAQRDALAKQLRADGERDAAKRVKALRRPTVAAWGVNLLARDDPDGIAELLSAGADLARAQRRALSGVRDSGLRDATTRRRDVVRRLADRAVALLDEAGASGEAHRETIAATLEAASASDEAAEPVRQGRLSRELPAPSGFGDVGGLALLSPEPSAADEGPATEGRAAEPSAEEEERRRLEAAVREARETLEARRQAATEAEAEAADARRRADEAVRAAEEAEDEADRLERAAAKARRDAERARRAVDRAEEEADERQDLAARRRRAVIAADEALDEAEQALRAARR